MTIRKVYYGSVGPFLYDDAESVKDPDGDFSDENQSALTTDGGMSLNELDVYELHATYINSVESTTEQLTIYDSDNSTAAGWIIKEVVDGTPTTRVRAASGYEIMLSAGGSFVTVSSSGVHIPAELDVDGNILCFGLYAASDVEGEDADFSGVIRCDDLVAYSNIEGNYLNIGTNIVANGKIYTANSYNTHIEGFARMNVYVDGDHSAKFYPDSVGGGISSNGGFYETDLSFNTDSLDANDALTKIMEAYRSHDISKLPKEVKDEDSETGTPLVNQGNLLQAAFVIIEKMNEELKELKGK